MISSFRHRLVLCNQLNIYKHGMSNKLCPSHTSICVNAFADGKRVGGNATFMRVNMEVTYKGFVAWISPNKGLRVCSLASQPSCRPRVHQVHRHRPRPTNKWCRQSPRLLYVPWHLLRSFCTLASQTPNPLRAICTRTLRAIIYPVTDERARTMQSSWLKWLWLLKTSMLFTIYGS